MLTETGLIRRENMDPALCRNGRNGLVVSTTTLSSLLPVIASTALHHGSLVVPSAARSVVPSTALLGSSWAVVSASSNGHCECDCGGDEKSKEMNSEMGFGLWSG